MRKGVLFCFDLACSGRAALCAGGRAPSLSNEGALLVLRLGQLRERHRSAWKHFSVDAAGDLFGVSAVGGGAGSGAAFEMVANAQRTSWTFGVIHNFCAETGCPDGQNPFGSVAIDKAGNFYGTTYTKAKNNGGAVYMLSPGSGGQWTMQILTISARLSFPRVPTATTPNTRSPMRGNPKANSMTGSRLFGTTIGGFNGDAFALKPGNRRWKKPSSRSFARPTAADTRRKAA